MTPTDLPSFPVVLFIFTVERERLRAELEPDLIQACSDVGQLRGILRRIGFNAINGEYKETPLFR